ncbi:hypothetical protein HY642_02660 [Candidatus Woesearchaeota archaeon]|nr:hypothetical protein [Candidatus Woesearchaeota archaeon]
MRERKAAQATALERIKTLFTEAEKRPAMADRYVQIIRKLQTRYRVRMPAALKHKYCKKCGTYWAPNKVRIRVGKGRVAYYCLVCKHISRRGYGK